MLKSDKISTGLVRLSYAFIWEPKENEESGEKQYRTALLLPKSDKKTYNKITKAIKKLMDDPDVIQLMGGKKKMNGLAMPLRDGDADRPDDPAFEDMYFMNAKANEDFPPRIVDKNKQEILDHSEVYSGCWVQAVITIFAYNKKGHAGFSVGLAGIRKIKDGEPLSGTVVTDNDFDDEDLDGVEIDPEEELI